MNYNLYSGAELATIFLDRRLGNPLLHSRSSLIDMLEESDRNRVYLTEDEEDLNYRGWLLVETLSFNKTIINVIMTIERVISRRQRGNVLTIIPMSDKAERRIDMLQRPVFHHVSEMSIR